MQELRLDKIKQRELSLLKDFAKYCDEHNLCYVLAGGTLLGAIRHKGFIPWDDDIDVMMPRTDYVKFLYLQQNDRNFSLRTISDNSSCIPFIKILDKGSVVDSKYVDIPNANALWIDVFPIDGLPEKTLSLKLRFKYIHFLRKCLVITMAKPAKGTSVLRAIVKTVLYYPLKCVGSYRFARWIDLYSQKINIDKTKYIGGLVWGYGPQERMPKKEWLDRVKVEFEGCEFWAPGCWDLYLSNLYGNYMQLPPEEKRITHNMVAYVKE